MGMVDEALASTRYIDNDMRRAEALAAIAGALPL
jgi:hypothetical protein